MQKYLREGGSERERKRKRETGGGNRERGDIGGEGAREGDGEK